MLSCHPNTYGRFGPEAALRLLPLVGITHLELPIRTSGQPSLFAETPLLTDVATSADLAGVRRRLASAGMSLSSCNVTSGNVLEPGPLETTLHKLELAAELGATLVVGGGGEATDAGQTARLHDHLRRIGDRSRQLGLIYCCETHPGACQNAERMAATMQAVDHPHVRINFDTGNLLFYNRNVDLRDSLRQVAPWVRHVHLKDTPGGFEQWHFVELGSGCVDFREVLETLSAAGFDGPCSLELEGIRGEPPPSLELLQQRVERSVQHLLLCGLKPTAKPAI